MPSDGESTNHRDGPATIASQTAAGKPGHFMSKVSVPQDLAVQRKNDYQFREEGFGKEASAWSRAVLMLVGKEGVS